MNSKKLAVIALILIVVTPIGVGFLTSVSETEVEVWEPKQSVNISDLLLNHQTDYSNSYVGTTNNDSLAGGLAVDYVKTSSVYTPYPIYSSTAHSMSFATPVNRTITYSDWSMEIPNGVTILAQSSRGIMDSFEREGQGIITVHDNQVYYNGRLLTTHADTLTWGSIPSRTLVVREYSSNITNYANVVYGWHLPSPNTVYWGNNQTNLSVSMSVELPDDDEFYLTDFRIYNQGGTVYVVNIVDNVPHILGDYRYLSIDVSTSRIIVSGLSSWPNYGGSGPVFNQVEAASHLYDELSAITDHPEYTTQLNMQNPSKNVVFRIDSAVVVAGTFPSTYDLTFDLATYYPSESSKIKLNSIGIYGESISINGTAYNVDNGAIIVNGSKIPLKGAEIQSTFDEGTGNYAVSINGVELADSADPLSIYFGGEWSLTAHALILEKSTRTDMTWVAGGFGLDKTGFIACGMLTCLGVFVVLGMTGKLTGSKIALLGFVCGGALITYFLIL